MLALPVVTAMQSPWMNLAMVIFSWGLMTMGAFALLYVNLKMPAGSNLVSMTRHSLGRSMAILTWAFYLLLLYSLLCAFLAAGGDVVQALLAKVSIPCPRWLATVLCVTLLGAIVYRGLYSVDLVNRILMLVKIAVCFALIASVAPFMHWSKLDTGSVHIHGSALLVIICSFGYAIILPSLRVYLDSNSRQLYRAVWIGSLIPMALYVIWIAAIQATVPRSGADGLVALNHSANTTSMLMQHLVSITHNPIVQSLGVVFISICAITAFLGVSVSLMDFLADGLKLNKRGKSGVVLLAVTFVPPLLIVLVAPQVFTIALAYAGVFCIYILIALPLMMAWKIRKCSHTC